MRPNLNIKPRRESKEMNGYKSLRIMKAISFESLKYFLASLVVFASFSFASAQDDDGIYGDIFETPEVIIEEEEEETSPLDGYSTVDDYYPEDGNTGNAPQSEQYVDEEGNTVINNYYGDDYDDSDFGYAARINRFHRPVYGYSYYDSYYTNLYWYTYDPYYYGSSIYGNSWCPYYGNSWSPWYSYGGWSYGWGWNNPYYTPAYYGGWNYGYGGSYWNGYNNGYWNGYNDGLASGGYYNTYDGNSGIYYGHRGSSGTTGTGYRSSSFAEKYNKAAVIGKANHANKGNYLEMARAGSVVADRNVSGYNTATRIEKTEVKNNTVGTRSNAEVSKGEVSRQTMTTTRERSTEARNTVAPSNAYQRQATDRNVNTEARTRPSNIDRSRQRSSVPERTRTQPSSRNNTYERGNPSTRYSSRTQSTRPTENRSRGNTYQDAQRTRPNSGTYNRGNSNRTYTQPTRPSSPSRNNGQQTRPSNNRQYNQKAPSRNYSKPSTPSSPAQRAKPNRGSSSKGSSYSAPSRSSGSSTKPSSGSSGRSSGGSSKSSGSRSRGGGRN